MSIYLSAALECVLEELILKVIVPGSQFIGVTVFCILARDSVFSLQEFGDALNNDFNIITFFAKYDEFTGSNLVSHFYCD